LATAGVTAEATRLAIALATAGQLDWQLQKQPD